MSEMICILGKENLADPVTKPDGPLIDALHLTLHRDRLALSFPTAEHTRYDKPLGQIDLKNSKR